MLTLTMMNDNDIASKFKATIRITFVFIRIAKTRYRHSPSAYEYRWSDEAAEVKGACVH